MSEIGRWLGVAWLAPALLALAALAAWAAAPADDRAAEARQPGQVRQPVAAPQPAEVHRAAERPLPSASLPPDLQRVLDDYQAVWSAHDAASLAALFDEDGLVLADGGPPVRGRAAIRKLYAAAGGPLALRALAFAAEGTVGYIVGAYARQAGGEDVGKFTLTLRRPAGGRWLIVSDMDNLNRRR
jgi:ketosteroid isomerase-like protein